MPRMIFPMRRWGIASFLCVVALPMAASAQTADVDVGASADDSSTTAAPDQTIGYGAMPGGLHVSSAETLAKGVVQVSNLDGFGYRTGLLGAGSKFTRLITLMAA